MRSAGMYRRGQGVPQEPGGPVSIVHTGRDAPARAPAFIHKKRPPTWEKELPTGGAILVFNRL